MKECLKAKPESLQVEYEAMFLFDNNKTKFMKLIEEGYFDCYNSDIINHLKSKAINEFQLQAHQRMLKKQAQAHLKTTLNQNPSSLYQDIVKSEPSELEKVLWNSILPTRMKLTPFPLFR